MKRTSEKYEILNECNHEEKVWMSSIIIGDDNKYLILSKSIPIQKKISHFPIMLFNKQGNGREKNLKIIIIDTNGTEHP